MSMRRFKDIWKALDRFTSSPSAFPRIPYPGAQRVGCLVCLQQPIVLEGPA